jgi:hypothetical protein
MVVGREELRSGAGDALNQSQQNERAEWQCGRRKSNFQLLLDYRFGCPE